MSDRGGQHSLDQERWLDKARNIDRLVLAVYVICGLLLLIGGALSLWTHAFDHAHYGFERVFGFYGFVGFVSFVFLVFVAKGLRKLVERPEDYYARPEDDEQ